MAEKANRKAKRNGRARAGHNSGEIPAEIVERWWQKIVAGQAAVERATKPLQGRKSELRAIYKAAEADGIDVEAMKEAIEKDKLDHIEVVTRYTNTGSYLRAHKSPLGVQLNLFTAEAIPLAMQAAVAGKRSGLRGGSVDENPYPPGSEAFVAYRDNWDAGQQELRDRLH